MVVKILIPIAASGIMIGKQGSAVRGMSEASSCHIQLGDANDPYQTFERILTITSKTGSLANVVHGAQLAATHLFNGDKDAISYINVRTSYAATPIMPQAMGGGQPHGMPPGIDCFLLNDSYFGWLFSVVCGQCWILVIHPINTNFISHLYISPLFSIHVHLFALTSYQ